MKWNMLVGSLVLGVSLCSQSFGFDLLHRMLGGRGCGCDTSCCDTVAADPSCGCEMAAPACGSGCASGGCASAGPSCGCEIAAPACGGGCASAAPSCGCEIAAPSCDPCGRPARKPLIGLLKRIKGKLCSTGCDTGCGAAPSCGCEIAAPACGSGCGAAPSCGCEMAAPACGSGCGAAPSCGCEMAAPACDSGCGCGRKGKLLGLIFKKRGSSCCDASACDSCGTVASSGCSSCGSSAVSAPMMHSDAAPMVPAPVVDPQAYLNSKRRVIQASSFVR